MCFEVFFVVGSFINVLRPDTIVLVGRKASNYLLTLCSFRCSGKLMELSIGKGQYDGDPPPITIG